MISMVWETRQVAGTWGGELLFAFPSPPFYRYQLTTTFGPTGAPFLPLLRTAAHAKVPSRSDPTSHPLPSPSSPKPHSQRPKPNPALYDSDANAKRRAWLYPCCQHLHCPQRRRTTSLGSYSPFPTAPTLGHAHPSCHCSLLPTLPSPAHKHEHSQLWVFVWHAF